MKYVLVKYKDIKLLINEGCSAEALIKHIAEIEELSKRLENFYLNVFNANADEVPAIEYERRQLISKIGYKITGEPFTNEDAELYALNEKLDYTELHLEAPPRKEYERINIDVEKPIKTLAVKHVNNSQYKNLAQYIEHLIKKDLGI